MATSVAASGYDTGLRPIPVSRLTSQTDAEIIASLLTYQPVTSERNVWAFWDRGFEAMPPWTQRNVLGWVRRLGASWTIRLLDIVPGSPNNAHRFAEPSNLPEAFNERRLNGKAAGQHAADFVRLAVLYQFGGVYMDVGTMLFRDLDDICWSALEDPSSPYEVAGFTLQFRKHFGQIINSFVACRKGNLFIHRWLLIFVRMWTGRADAVGIHHHPLVRHLGLLSLDDPTFGENPNWEEFTDYAAQILAYERVRLTREPEDNGFDGSEYFRKHFFLLDAWNEMYRGQDVVDGSMIFEIFSMPRGSLPSGDQSDPIGTGCKFQDDSNSRKDGSDEKQKLAREFVHGLLANSCLCKLSQGFWQPGMPMAAASFWKRPELADADSRPGTWGEYVRYGCIHFEQTRESGKVLEPLPTPEEADEVHTIGLFEPVESDRYSNN